MLYVFGDSYPAGICKRSGEEPKMYVDKGFPEVLSEALNVPLYKEAFAGASCMDTINALTSNIYRFQKGDVVVLALPPFDRVNLPVDMYSKDAEKIVDRKRKDGAPKRKTLVGVALYNGGLAILSGNYKEADWLVEFIKKALTPEVYGGTEMGFEYFLKLLLKVNVDLGYGGYENYSNYYTDWATNLSTYFIKNDIKFVVYTSHWWAYINKYLDNESNKCECGHWNERGHYLFSLFLEEFLENYKQGEFMMTPPGMTSIQMRYLSGNGYKNTGK